MKTKKVVVIDGGGRGAVLADKYSQSKFVSKVLVVSGNDFVKTISPKIQTFPNIKTIDIQKIVNLCRKEKVSLIDVAHDNAVEAGLVNELTAKGFAVVGPKKEAGQIEWDKGWSREFMKKYEIPHPKFQVCHSEKEGIDFIKKQKNGKWFVKASGLMEGKGALPAINNKDAIIQIKKMKSFGKAGETFVIEQWLEGEEFSCFAVCDGKRFQIIGSAQDHKRVFNFDEGANTGGMGCSTPPLAVNSSILKQAKNIIKTTLDGLRKEGRPYKGILYLGAIVVGKEVFVIEFNARWGDPEAQVLIPGIQDDFYELGMAVSNGDISDLKIKTDGKSRVVIAGASRGYPENVDEVRGKEIFGLDEVRQIKNIKIYSAGVKVQSGKYFANGGRLFYIVGEGKNVIQARSNAYQAMSLIYIDGNNLHFRTDIGYRDVQRLRGQ